MLKLDLSNSKLWVQEFNNNSFVSRIRDGLWMYVVRFSSRELRKKISLLVSFEFHYLYNRVSEFTQILEKDKANSVAL